MAKKNLSKKRINSLVKNYLSRRGVYFSFEDFEEGDLKKIQEFIKDWENGDKFYVAISSTYGVCLWARIDSIVQNYRLYNRLFNSIKGI